MKLRSGKPYWYEISTDRLNLPALSGDIACQVAVLGAGITGALVADHLLKSGLHVILLDRHEVGQGSTAASTGLLQYEVDTPLVSLIKRVGEQHAVHAYRRGLAAIDEIESLVHELDDDCGFSRRKSLYFASTCWHQRRLRREYECQRQHGFDVEYLNRQQLADISSIPAAAALRSGGDAQIDPFRFTQQLVQAGLRRNLQAFSNTDVQSIEELHDRVLLQAGTGTISADFIVYATGYESERHLKSPTANLNSTYAVTSQAGLSIQGWPEDCLIWETARPYFYARRTEDGRAMIGGEDTEFSNDHDRDGLVDRKIGKLVARFHALFPNTEFSPEYAWAGTFAETKDGLAYIGQPTTRPRAYFALGYGGNGITFSMIAAKLINDLILGRPNRDAEVFKFGR
ncbi:MAG TPA: FAD-dependent oxidoreductase [Pirellulales bacterium]|nr:FAD-dependent oxidoreductase [Pirellulales bacterium]